MHKLLSRIMKLLPMDLMQHIDAQVHRIQSRLLPKPVKEAIQVEAGGEIPGRLLVATASGLIVFEGSTGYRIIGGFFFGLTFYKGRWYAFRKVSRRSGQVISFTLDGLQVSRLQCEIQGLSPRIHQIDAFEDKLYLMDTYNNRLLIYDLKEPRLGRPIEVYPAGRAASRSDPNYVHMNSVLITEDHIYLMYHNLSRDTGRGSRVVVLNHQYEVQQTIHLEARCAHNVAFWKEKMVYCGSQDGTLHIGAHRLELEDWSRGIALFDEACVVGGSQRAMREERVRGDGYLYHCDLQLLSVVSKGILKDVGSVYEVRSIDPLDQSLSENVRRKEMKYKSQGKALA